MPCSPCIEYPGAPITSHIPDVTLCRIAAPVPLVQVTLALSCVLGLSINHSTFVCTRINDPLTTSVAGSIKNIMMTLLGALAFPDFRFRPSNAAGLGISMAGAIYYATKTAQRVRLPRPCWVLQRVLLRWRRTGVCAVRESCRSGLGVCWPSTSCWGLAWLVLPGPMRSWVEWGRMRWEGVTC